MASTSDPAFDGLDDHGDRQVPAGAVDLAVNVIPLTPPWLREELAGLDLSRYPSSDAAAAAAAARHGVAPDQCLLTNGAAESFWALAQALRPRFAVCVHPSFTAPEAALHAAGVSVHRVVRRAEDDFALDVAEIPEQADLVVLGRPDNPTGRLEPAGVVASLIRPGRTVVVDEAFADFLPDGESLASRQLPGVLCVRSLTKLWGLAGVRVGYVLGEASLLRRLRRALQPWPANVLAVHAVQRLSGMEVERRLRASRVAASREALVTGIAGLQDESLRMWPSAANFVLLRRSEPGLRARLLEHGIATRRGQTFPGLDARYVRTAVPFESGPREALLTALEVISRSRGTDGSAMDPGWH